MLGNKKEDKNAMKKILSLALALALAFSLVACTSKDNSEDGGQPEGTYEIALVTDYGNIDDQSFNQHTWEGVKQYGEEMGVTYGYYRPVEASTDGYSTSIEMAINNGAKIVVMPGFSFNEPVGLMQEAYPDVKFIWVDGDTSFEATENTYAIVYAEEQSGFLAGYAAVMDGYRKLGFMGGMAVPAVIRYGYGFAQGAEAAAKELGLPEGEVELMYAYTGGFEATPDITTKAAAWYQNGTEIIFSCGGPIVNSIIAAAETYNEEDGTPTKFIIGVDIDQSYLTENGIIVTSAMKELKLSVYTALKDNEAGNFPGGQVVALGAAEEAVGLPMETSLFKNFTQEDYDEIYGKLKTDEDGIASNLLKGTEEEYDTDGDGGISVKELNEALTYVTVTDAN